MNDDSREVARHIGGAVALLGVASGIAIAAEPYIGSGGAVALALFVAGVLLFIAGVEPLDTDTIDAEDIE